MIRIGIGIRIRVKEENSRRRMRWRRSLRRGRNRRMRMGRCALAEWAHVVPDVAAQDAETDQRPHHGGDL